MPSLLMFSENLERRAIADWRVPDLPSRQTVSILPGRYIFGYWLELGDVDWRASRVRLALQGTTTTSRLQVKKLLAQKKLSSKT